MKAEVMTITPDIARQWLERNPINRKLSQAHVRRIAQAIQNREWAMNGEAIKFNCDGTLLDGQHRLLAVIECGIPVQSLVITGISSDAQGTMDLGRTRSLVDFLRMDGVTNAVVCASIVTMVNRVEATWRAQTEGRIGNTWDWSPVTVGSHRSRYHSEAERFTQASLHAMQLNGVLKFPRSSLGALAYFAEQLHPDEWSYFVESVKTGENLSHGDPALALRSASMRRSHDGKRSIDQLWAFGISTKAWNAFVTDARMVHPKFLMNGSRREPLPPVL